MNLETLPKEPGVYLMKNKRGEILYIGKAKQLRVRVKQYFIPGRDGRMMVPFLTSQVTQIDTIVTFSEKEALLLESNLIKKHRPKYNVLLKDDKTFISLTINHQATYPMVRLARYRGLPPKNLLSFGPYTSAYAARQTLNLMNRVFKLRQCSDRELSNRSRPCLLYSIKRCLAPCVEMCSKSAYAEEVNQAIEFLKGNDRALVKMLKEEMKSASEQLEFEKAGAIYKTLQQIEHVTKSKQAIIRSKGKDCDIFSLYHEGKHHLIAQLMYRDGRLIGANHFKFIELASSDEAIWETFLMQHYGGDEKAPPEVLLPLELSSPLLEELLSTSLIHPKIGEKAHLIELAHKNAVSLLSETQSQEELLLDLQEMCSLSHFPAHIECFDTSSISGSDIVACMVGFIDGKRSREQTKLFSIKGVDKSDDYGAMREALTRHFIKAKEKDCLPNLVLLDGGKGQLNVALEVFKSLGIANVDLIALAKEEGRHDKGLRLEKIFIPEKKEPILLSPRSSTLFILQKIRDEAHRIVINYHRKKRSHRLIQTELDQIAGIGPKKRTLLLKEFGSVKKLKEASLEELQKIKGITKRDIEALLAFQKP